MKKLIAYYDKGVMCGVFIGLSIAVLSAAGYEVLSPMWETVSPAGQCTLETSIHTDASKAAFCGECVATVEFMEVPVYINTGCEREAAEVRSTCDCTPEYSQGFEDGFGNCVRQYENPTETKARTKTQIHERNYRR